MSKSCPAGLETKSITSEHGSITVDCYLYAQLVNSASSGDFENNGGFILEFGADSIGEPGEYFSLSPRRFSQAYDAIQALPTSNKGIWLVPCKNGYLGLSTQGPKVFLSQQWIDRLIKGLKIDVEKCRSNKNDIESGLPRCLILQIFAVRFRDVYDNAENWESVEWIPLMHERRLDLVSPKDSRNKHLPDDVLKWRGNSSRVRKVRPDSID